MNDNTLVWISKKFSELTLNQLYDFLFLRQQIFIIEQNCLYSDIDGIDKKAFHVMGYLQKDLKTYARVFEENNFAIIGRVLVDQSARGTGLGQKIMHECLNLINNHYPHKKIKVSAQLYLKKFYEDFGFSAVSEPYEEDGIPHITMEK